MATVTKPIALDESLNTTEQSSRNIADVLAQEIGNLVTVVSRIAPPTTVSWNQIEQSGTKIAEITINGTKTDVYAPQGGGGFSALIIVTDALAGVTITATKGGVTKTGTSIGNNQYEISVDSSGTWTISDGTNTATVTVTAQTTYYLTLGVPDGSTVTPTDDIQTLLNCANIWDKSYTTLTELLYDSTSLQAVISSNNAIDYLVRSTSFAKSEALVPVMTSNNTPSGYIASASNEYTGREAYKAFDKNTAQSSLWETNSENPTAWLQMEFPNEVNVSKLSFYADMHSWSSGQNYLKDSKFKVQYGDTPTDVSGASFTIAQNDGYANQTVDFANNIKSKKWRVQFLEANIVSAVNGCTVNEIQFYSEDGFTDNSTAMSYIGLNNYASNTLLADSTWCSAICNSTYFESVLNVKVPTMTGYTTPSGQVYYTSFAGGNYTWRAFDGNLTTEGLYVYGQGDGAVTYEFPTAQRIILATVYIASGTVNYHRNQTIKSSDDNITFNAESDTKTAIIGGTNKFIFNNGNVKKYWQMYGDTLQGGGSAYVNEIQFYGRADV